MLALVLAISLSGCGFHLRGSADLTQGFKSAYLDVSGAPVLAAELRNLLTYGGVQLTSSRAGADIVIELGNENFDRRVLSVSPTTGKAREFELGYRANLRVTRGNGDVMLARQPVTLVRDFTFDETAVLGKDTEESVLRRELRISAADLILRRLQTLR